MHFRNFAHDKFSISAFQKYFQQSRTSAVSVNGIAAHTPCLPTYQESLATDNSLSTKKVNE